MIFDFTILDRKVDGLVIYARNLYKCISNKYFLNEHTYIARKSVSNIGNKFVGHVLVHRLKLFSFSTDFYYSPTHHSPVFKSNKLITIHDLTPLIIKKKSFSQYIYFNFFLPISARRAKRIITVSNFTKKLLQEHYLVNPNNVSVIYNGTEIDSVVESVVEGLPQNFMLMVGVHSEYKNFELAYKALRSVSGTYPLVITGTFPKIKEIFELDPNVIHLSQLSYSQIKYLYLHATALLYPSLLEGFGLPALEAARLKCPVITTRDSSMQEFLKDDAALYVDPSSEASIAGCINTVISEESLVKNLVERAYENTLHLTWEKHCSEVIKLIEQESKK